MQTSKELCPLCGQYATVDTKTTKITCKVSCEANGMTRAQAKAEKKRRSTVDENAKRNAGKGVIDPWAN